MTVLAIVNPVAGRHAGARIWRRLWAEHAAVRGWEYALTQRPGHACELAASAAAAGRIERVVAVGGDGTISEVAGGLADSQTPLGIIPAGTGNDFARNLGIPPYPAAAAALAASGAPRHIDLGQVRTPERTTWFAGVAGCGFDAQVAWRVNRLPKLIGGTMPYVVGVLQTLWRYRSPRARLTIDGQRLQRELFLVAVANCASYGGGMRIAPGARPDDGELEVCLVNDLRRVEVLRLLPALYTGGHVGHPAVELFRCRSIRIEADGPLRCHADGELVGGLPARFDVAPRALRCVTGSF